MNYLVDEIESIAGALLTKCMALSSRRPSLRAVHDLALSYIAQLEWDSDIKVDAETGVMVKPLDHSKYVNMTERYKEWILMVEQASCIGEMKIEEELHQTQQRALYLLSR